MTSLATEAYQELSEIEHVLLRPGMYLGPVDRVQREALCYYGGKIQSKLVNLSEAQEQTFLEIIGNAADNIQRSREHGIDPGSIEVAVSAEWITVKNYGMHIPVDRNDRGEWIPDMIFGRFRTSSNYDDTQTRMYIGMNGIGSKGVNVFSLAFNVVCADPQRGLLYQQTWNRNMTQKDEAQISQYTGPGYTQISYSLDFARFGVQSFDQEALEIYAAHCAAVSLTCQVPVIYNGETFQPGDIIGYAGLFFTINKQSAITYTDPNGVYQLCLVDTPDSAVCLSFVNGIITKAGGVHVDAAYKVVVEGLKEYLGKTAEGITLTKKDITNHVSLFLMCRLNQPVFKSQTKDCLARPKPNIELPQKVLEGIKKWKLIERIYEEIQRKQLNKLKKTDGKRKGRPKNDKLRDANIRGQQSVLILIEGDSASAYPVKFVGMIPEGKGWDYFGILPLHGKLLNTLNADFLQILENRDLNHIKEALGLQETVDYTNDANYRKLRYGSIWVIPDADTDGKHILGLVLVFFMHRFPSLVGRGFFKFLRTPIVRVQGHGQRYMFYTMNSYQRWHDSTLDADTAWKHEYFKGLGSSEDHHIAEDFQNPRVVTFQVDEKAVERLLLAFRKTDAALRKQWLASFVDQEILEVESFSELPISVFLDHELSEYVVESLTRAIPEMIDGLKDSQRRAVFALQKHYRGKKTKDKVKVGSMAEIASSMTNYKHGPDSLADAIVLLAQSFVGSNNLPLIHARAQLGTRTKGGKDAAKPRYTFIDLPWYFELIFRKEDQRIQKTKIDEGQKCEYENFFPLIPLQLVNGANGIATAYSTTIPSHNPLDVAFWYQQRILQDLQPDQNHQLPLLRPWYKGFKGDILTKGNGFLTKGRFYIQPGGQIIIDELPIGTWTDDYKNFLIAEQEKGTISDFDNNSNADLVRFVIHSYFDGAPTLRKLKLITQHSYSNMTVIYRLPTGVIQPRTYNNILEMLEDFYKIRLNKYEERRTAQINEIENEIQTLSEKARFILGVVKGEIEIRNRVEAELESQMTGLNLSTGLLDKVNSRHYTQEKVAQLNQNIERKRQEKADIEATHPGQIWYSELEEFIAQYCRKESVTRSTFDSCNPPTTLTIGED